MIRNIIVEVKSIKKIIVLKYFILKPAHYHFCFVGYTVHSKWGIKCCHNFNNTNPFNIASISDGSNDIVRKWTKCASQCVGNFYLIFINLNIIYQAQIVNV